jgi:hypothetical protein
MSIVSSNSPDVYLKVSFKSRLGLTVRKFPLTTHISINANKEVKHYKLERTPVVEPFIKTCCFPDRIEVKTNSIRTWNNSTRDDVVSIHKRTSNWFTNPVAYFI